MEGKIQNTRISDTSNVYASALQNNEMINLIKLMTLNATVKLTSGSINISFIYQKITVMG